MSFKVEYANEFVKTIERSKDQHLLWEHKAEDGTCEVLTDTDLFSGIKKTAADGTVLEVFAMEADEGISHFCGYLAMSPKLSSRFSAPKDKEHLAETNPSVFDRFVEFHGGCTFCDYNFEKKTWKIGFDCAHYHDIYFFLGHVNGNRYGSHATTFKSREFVMDVLEKAYKNLKA